MSKQPPRVNLGVQMSAALIVVIVIAALLLALVIAAIRIVREYERLVVLAPQRFVWVVPAEPWERTRGTAVTGGSRSRRT